jgi:hypothetical protein
MVGSQRLTARAMAWPSAWFLKYPARTPNLGFCCINDEPLDQLTIAYVIYASMNMIINTAINERDHFQTKTFWALDSVATDRL